MTETIKQWIKHAEDDVVTARVMLDGGRYSYVPFCCQQAIEKALKAVIISKTAKLAPKIHNLPRLVELADIPVDYDQLALLARLSALYFQSRYPGKTGFEGPAARVDAQRMFTQTEEMVKWLLSTLK